jgi:hypothetical protein
MTSRGTVTDYLTDGLDPVGFVSDFSWNDCIEITDPTSSSIVNYPNLSDPTGIFMASPSGLLTISSISTTVDFGSLTSSTFVTPLISANVVNQQPSDCQLITGYTVDFPTISNYTYYIGSGSIIENYLSPIFIPSVCTDAYLYKVEYEMSPNFTAFIPSWIYF